MSYAQVFGGARPILSNISSALFRDEISTMIKNPAPLLFIGSLLVPVAFSCSSELNDDTGVEDGGGMSNGGQSGKLYAIATAVSDDTSANTYVKVFSEFEEELDLSEAREFPGWSDMGVVGPYVFVSSGESPTVWRFRVGTDGELIDDGKIGFGNFVDDANFYNQTLVSETKAYLIGTNEYIVWNPSTLKITGTFPFADLPDHEGVAPYIALDRGAAVRDGFLYHAVAWSDAQELHMLPDSRIVVIDLESDSVVDVLTVPCPDLSVADQDEEGNLYFSNWVYSPGYTLLEGGVSACAVRIPAGGENIDDWRLPYAEVTGHEGAIMGYLGSGHWMFSEFLHEPSEYDPKEDWFDWLFGDYWRLNTVDPVTLTTQPIDGIPRNGGGYYASRLDDRTHVLIPGDSYTSTTVFSITDAGQAKKRMYTNGWATRLFRVR